MRFVVFVVVVIPFDTYYVIDFTLYAFASDRSFPRVVFVCVMCFSCACLSF